MLGQTARGGAPRGGVAAGASRSAGGREPCALCGSARPVRARGARRTARSLFSRRPSGSARRLPGERSSRRRSPGPGSFALGGRFEEEAAVYETVRAHRARARATRARGAVPRAGGARAARPARVRPGDRPARGGARRCGGRSGASAPRSLLDLAAALITPGDAARERERLSTSALAAAAAAGREDLARIARGNRVELLVNRCAWDEAARRDRGARGARPGGTGRLRLLVALHHRGRLALRRGFLADAARDNAEARRLADDVARPAGDRRALARGGRPPSLRGRPRGRAARRGRERPPRPAGPLRPRAARPAGGWRSSSWREPGGPPRRGAGGGSKRSSRATRTRAAETVARWTRLFGGRAVPASLAGRARRASCGSREARRSPSASSVAAPSRCSSDALRRLRGAVVAVLSGETPTSTARSARLGLVGARGARRGGPGGRRARGRLPLAGGVAWRPLEAGARPLRARALAGAASPRTSRRVALLLETLLYRARRRTPAPPTSPPAWRRLGIVTADASMEEPYRRLVAVRAAAGHGARPRRVGLAARRRSRARSTALAARPPGPSCGQRRRRSRRRSSRASSSATRAARSPARSATAGACSKRRAAARSSSTRSATSPLAAAGQAPARAPGARDPARRREPAAADRRARRLGDVARPGARRSRRGAFARTSTTASTWRVIRLPPLRERGPRRAAAGAALPRALRPRVRRGASFGSRREAPPRSRPTPGRATCASCRTPWRRRRRSCEPDGLRDPALLPERVRRALARSAARPATIARAWTPTAAT